MTAVIIVYDPTGETEIGLADNLVEQVVEEIRYTLTKLLPGDEVYVPVANELSVMRVQVAIVEGVLPWNYIFFEYEGKRHSVNRYGVIDAWSFSVYGNMCERLLLTAIKTRKEERNR